MLLVILDGGAALAVIAHVGLGGRRIPLVLSAGERRDRTPVLLVVVATASLLTMSVFLFPAAGALRRVFA